MMNIFKLIVIFDKMVISDKINAGIKILFNRIRLNIILPIYINNHIENFLRKKIMPNRPMQQEQIQGGLATKPKIKKPSLYKVIMLNDDFTPMEFVVSLLQSIFGKTTEEATEIMLQVHRSGIGVCGIYTFEIAEMKAAQVIDAARRSQHPLRCEVERV